jgi:hypothetical protein
VLTIRQYIYARQEARTANSTYPKGGVSCSKDSFVVAESSVILMKFSAENPAVLAAAKRYSDLKKTLKK